MVDTPREGRSPDSWTPHGGARARWRTSAHGSIENAGVHRARRLHYAAPMRSNDLRRVFRHVLSLSLLPAPAVLALGACGGGVVDVDGNGAQDAAATSDGSAKDGGQLSDGAAGQCVAPNVKVWSTPGCGIPATGCLSPDSPRPGCYTLVCSCAGKVVGGCGSFDEPYTILPGGPGSGLQEGDSCNTKPPIDAGPTLDTGLPVDAGCVAVPAPVADAGFSCMSWTVPLPCAFPADAGFVSNPATCQTYCGPNANFCSKETESTLRCDPGCAIGRRPEGFVSSWREGDRDTITGQYFAAMTELEAASVWSFERLERELEAHGAPASLRARARRAAEDERRHARVAGALAVRFGAVPACAEEPTLGVRSLEAMALENAVEGCVRETFGALSATLQAERAQDPRVRAAMRRIATDETAHAGLAWAVKAWLDTRLDDTAKARLQEAMRAAAHELAGEVATEQPAILRDVAGLPTAAEASRMVNGMQAALWAA